MKKFLYLFLAVFLISCGTEHSSTISSSTSDKGGSLQILAVKVPTEKILAAASTGKYREGELLVKFKSGAVSSSAAAHQRMGATVLKKYRTVSSLEKVALPAGVSVPDAMTAYMSDPAVEYAEPNYIRNLQRAVPQDPFIGQQWALDNTGQFAGGTPGADIDAPEAWDITSGSSNIVVAVLDTGIDTSHPDLVGNAWINTGENCNNGIDDDLNGFIDDCKGWNTFDDTNDPYDDHGHGTHVSGIIGAVGNNFLGTAGVMWHVRLMPLKFIGYTEDPEECGGFSFCGSVADEVEAIDYAIDNGADIINASYGAYEYSQAEYDAIAAANNAGVIFIAAAGNESQNNDLTPLYPASYSLPNMISVAATDQNDMRAPFSNFGPASVDVAAPGVYILSTIPLAINPGGYDFSQGTSMAAPHVTGLAGLLKTYYTHFNIYQIIWTINRYTDPSPLVGWTVTGGRINAYRAVSSLLTPANLVGVAVSPVAIQLTWTDAATGEDSYTVEGTETPGTFALQATLPANSNSFLQGGLKDGTPYVHRVRAHNTLPADSFYSAVATTVTPVSPPTNLKATPNSKNSIGLTWTDTSQTEAGFRIERRTRDSEFNEIGTTGPNTTSYTATGLTRSTLYWFRVRAYNAVAGNSEPSNEAEARTKGGGGGGGGGCSIGSVQNTPTALANMLLLLVPFIFIAVMRRRR